MKLKKILYVSGFLTALLCFTSCDLILGILEGIVTSDTGVEDTNLSTTGTEDKLLKNDNRDVLFIQVNNENKEFSNKEVGYIAAKSNTREAEVDEEISVALPETIASPNYDKYHAKVQGLNVSADKYLYNNGARENEPIKTKVRDVKREIGKSYDYYYVIDENDKQVFTKKTAVCKANGQYCNVLFIKDTSLVAESDIDFAKIAENFDAIYEKETSIVGTNRYETKVYSNLIDPMAKIDVIVADIMEAATKDQEGGVFGYFHSNDFLINGDYEYWENDEKQTYTISCSNEAQAIYVDSYFLKTKTNQVYSTLVHEFNHLLNYCQKTCYYGLNYMSSWYTEMLSMVTEDLFQHYLKIEDIDSPKARMSLFNCSAYYGFENWQDGDDVYRSYANAFAFGAYLVRNFGGVPLLKEIATNKYIDKDSITEALHKLNYNYDYAKVLRYFPMVYVNPKTDGNSEEYKSAFTLNRSITYADDSTLYFDAINLYDYSWKLYSSNTKYTEMKGPYYLDAGYVYNLLPSGFFINSVCRKAKFDPSNYKVVYIDPVLYPNYYTYFVNYNKSYN